MEHKSVLLAETVQQLVQNPDGIYVDCTFGRGGHSQAILQMLSSKGQLIALDRDIAANQSQTAEELRKDKRFTLIHAPFSQLQNILIEREIDGEIFGILMDLGVSSPQLDNAERGFSFLKEGPLDMRMDTSDGITAGQWLQTVDEQQLIKVLFEYGEERFARRIAHAITEYRQHSVFSDTLQLAQIIAAAIPRKEKHKHPATRSFQAIRIAINNELRELEETLPQAMNTLISGGRLAVISFHSLEDRMVKRFIRRNSGLQNDPGKLPVMEKDLITGKLRAIGKAIKPGKSELESNPRARSAVLRIAERRYEK